MIRKGILYPQINSLLSRVRHTNLLMIADHGGRLSPMPAASGKKRTVNW
jgi:D-ribose pyranose/furanose isomerase RbsD